MTDEEYFEKAQYLWQNYVPQSGQAETVQGELIRAIEKLRDEAQRNANTNFDHDCHVLLIEFLKTTLNDPSVFDQATIDQINQDLDRLLLEEQPYTEDDLYDRIVHRIVDWYLVNQKDIPHQENPMLYC